jgi:hypothetical protein
LDDDDVIGAGGRVGTGIDPEILRQASVGRMLTKDTTETNESSEFS